MSRSRWWVAVHRGPVEDFTDVSARRGQHGRRRQGGTKILVHHDPVRAHRSHQATFGYEAPITDGVVPHASISALPVSPLESPTFKRGAGELQGRCRGRVPRLDRGQPPRSTPTCSTPRDGSADLLAGLIQLATEPSAWNAGLSGEAAPGARKFVRWRDRFEGRDGQAAAGRRRSQVGFGAGR